MTNDPLFVGITLTGADERTDLDALAELVKQHPRLEIGLLYSATPEGRPRYPSLGWIDAAAHRLPGRCALHVCGRGAREAMLTGAIDPVLDKIRRVQVNGHVAPSEIFPLARRFPILITQWQPGRDTPELEAAIREVAESTGLLHQWLVDGSGGRGTLPGRWARPACDRPVGFAGGLGPDTLPDALPAIAEAARGMWWIDMETSLRTNDWFDIDRCRAVLRIASDALRSNKTAVAA